ncbi:MAG TPA: FAD/NAD(P)-binding oxidoreductase [Anaerolineales bacterium]|nr:FAD/NAD(P)-binding oxidoreductase [Anaerolineales bacterium]
MVRTKYLIVGGGLTGDAAIEGIREVDPDGGIVLLGEEPERPYNRPLLSKGLWLGKPFERVWRSGDRHGVDLVLGRRAVRLDASGKTVVDDRGEEYRYGSLLLATGGRVRRFAFGAEDVIYFRTLRDYRRLRELADRSQRFTVIGGGFIGSEIAAALASNGKAVTLVFPQAALVDRMLPRTLAEYVSFVYQEKGVVLRPAAKVLDVRADRGRWMTKLRFPSGSESWLESDGVVAGIGIEPEVELAALAGLEVDDGIVVDPHLQTSRPGVFAAGDAASAPSRALGRRRRVEHEDNALTMGRAAGRNMAGAGEAYTHLPFFYSDLFDLGYEAVGELDSRMETVSDWLDPYRKGVIYYLAEGKVRGVLLWNVWDRVPAARALIEANQPMRPDELIGRITTA